MLSREKAMQVSRYLHEYADSKGIYMKINFVNADHTHVLVDLPTNLTIEEIVRLLKGCSSHWINTGNLITGKFAWGRGYGAFSVSESNVKRVVEYISGQEEHHRVKHSSMNSGHLSHAMGCSGAKREAVITAVCFCTIRFTGLKPGVNDIGTSEKRSVVL